MTGPGPQRPSTLSLSAAQLIGGIVAVAILSATLIGVGVWLGSRGEPSPVSTEVEPPLAVVSIAPTPIASPEVATPTSPSPMASESPSPTPTLAPPTVPVTPAPTRKPTPRPTPEPQTLALGIAPFEPDPSSSDSLLFQQHQYLYSFIKPCPRAGCEDDPLDPRFAWIVGDWEEPIPTEFKPCLTNPDGAACYKAVTR